MKDKEGDWIPNVRVVRTYGINLATIKGKCPINMQRQRIRLRGMMTCIRSPLVPPSICTCGLRSREYGIPGRMRVLLLAVLTELRILVIGWQPSRYHLPRVGRYTESPSWGTRGKAARPDAGHGHKALSRCA